MSAPEEGRVNGQDSATEVQAAQRARYPYLELFAARARFPEGLQGVSNEPSHFEIRLGLRIGLKVGKTLTLQIPRGAPGALLAQLLRQAADAIDALVNDCASAANDERELIPKAMLNVMPAKGEACALCDSKDPQRFATCKRPHCPVARARDAAPIAIPGALAQAINDAYNPRPAPEPNTVTVSDARAHPYSATCGCAACATQRAEQAANAGKAPEQTG